MPKASVANRGVDVVSAQDFFSRNDGQEDIDGTDQPKSGKLWLTVLAGVAVLVVVGAGVLFFGDPQWHRLVYLAQQSVRGELVPPARYTGVWRDYYTNGKLKAEMHYAAGVPQGEFCCFHANGTPKLAGVILRTNPETSAEPYVYDGELTGWHENGRKHFQRVYRNEQVEGKAFTWFAGGSLQEYAEYHKGLLHGHYQAWDQDGRRQQCDEYYVEGRRHGTCVRWDNDVRVVADYRHGVPHGRLRGFDVDGKLVYEHWYKNGEPSEAFELKAEDSDPKTGSTSAGQG